MPEPWNDDPPGSGPQILANIVALGPSVAADAASRATPTVARAQDWHRTIYAGITLPVPYYAGEFRDSDPAFPELYGYEVAVGPYPGVPSAQVPTELAVFESRVQTACQRLDPAISAGQPPANDQELAAVITLCGIVHGEWVRIHPFANGNGRAARIWALWLGARYGLPPFIEIKSRPAGMSYAAAAAASMQGDHTLSRIVFEQMLRAKLGTP